MSRNQITPYDAPPDRGAGRRRDSPVFDSMPGEIGQGAMMLPAPRNADFSMGNSIQPKDKMAQYRDAALVLRGPMRHTLAIGRVVP